MNTKETEKLKKLKKLKNSKGKKRKGDKGKMNDINISDFYLENPDIEHEMNYNCLTFLDAMKIADEAWENGAAFDVDAKILSRVSSTSVVKIVQTDTLKVNNRDMYVVWGTVELDDLDFEVPIRFYSLIESYDNTVFSHKTLEPTRTYDLSALVHLLEEKEEKNWEQVLNEW